MFSLRPWEYIQERIAQRRTQAASEAEGEETKPAWKLETVTPDEATVATRWVLTVHPPAGWSSQWLPDASTESVTLPRGRAMRLYAPRLRQDLQIRLQSPDGRRERVVTLQRGALSRKNAAYLLNAEGDVTVAVWVAEMCTLTIDLLRVPQETLEAEIQKRGGSVMSVVP